MAACPLFPSWVSMVKFKRPHITVVTTYRTFSAQEPFAAVSNGEPRLFGVSHNSAVTAVCADCTRDKGVDPKHRERDPSASRIEAWAGARPRLKAPSAEVLVRKMRHGCLEGISRSP